MLLKKNRFSSFLVSAVLSSFLLLSSCLDINTDIEISGKGTVKTTLTYTLDESFHDFGRGFGSDDPWPFPLSEADFNQRVLLVEGTRLIRYRVKDNSEGGEQVTAVVRAESLETMALFLDVPMEMSTGDDGGSFVMELPADNTYRENDEASRQVIDNLVAESTVRFSVRPPSKPLESVNGVIDGRVAVLELKLIDVLYGRTPVSWTVTW